MTRLALAGAAAAAAVLCGSQSALCQSTMVPLSSFGTNGWLAPGSSPFLTVGHTERGLAYNPLTGNLVLVSRAGGNHVRVLDGATGADLGGFVTTGITGGTFAVNMAGVADDGAVYVGNLSTSAASNFKVYKWDSEAAGLTQAPSVAFDAVSGLIRTGDAFALHGGVATPVQFAAAGTSTTSNSSFAVGALDATNTVSAFLSVPGTSTASNDYRLALTFVDQDTLIGNQGGLARYTDFAGATATVAASIPLGGSARRAMDYAVIGGTPVLAVIDSVTATVTVFEVTNPATPILLATANNTPGGLTPNTNGTGSVQWGAITGNSAVLYAMNSNHGVQAFQVTIQPPASALPYGAGCGSPALTLTSVGAPVLPSTVILLVNNLPASTALGVALLGFAPIPGGTPVAAAPGCLLHVVPIATVAFVPLGASSYQLPQSFPADPAYAGLDIFVQAGALDVSNAIAATNGLRLHLQTF